MLVRAAVVTMVAMLAIGCGGRPTMTQDDPDAGDVEPLPDGGTGPARTVTFPIEAKDRISVDFYGETYDGFAGYGIEWAFGLGVEYPQTVTLFPNPISYITRGCGSVKMGKPRWDSLKDVVGDAAKVSVVGGELKVELQHEGFISGSVVGVMTELDECVTFEGTFSERPIQLGFSFQVVKPAGFLVDPRPFSGQNCGDTIQLASDYWQRRPTVSALNASMQKVDLRNAWVPVATTLRSTGTFTRTTEEGRTNDLWMSPGHVTISLETRLPVTGPTEFEVVDQTSVTELDMQLMLRWPVAKGDQQAQIIEGESYRLYEPARGATIDVRPTYLKTAAGFVCSGFPGSWFIATTTTPRTCEPAAMVEEFYKPVAKVTSLGECSIEVAMPGTSHRWATRFTTTGP